jgi:hypothetical protein
MDRQVLIKGFLKIFVPLAVGSIVAGTVGTLIGVVLGLGAYHTIGTPDYIAFAAHNLAYTHPCQRFA